MFRAQTIVRQPGSEDLYRTFEELLHLMMSSTPGDSTYAIQWLAHIVQNPGIKTGVGLMICGPHECGKGFVFERVLEQMIGSEMYGYTNQPSEDVFGRFGALRTPKILVNVDSFKAGDVKKDTELWKSKIASDTSTFEIKGGAVHTYDNCCNWVFTTNLDDPVHVEKGNRRTVIIACVPPEDSVLYRKHSRHAEYFNTLYALASDDQFIRSVYDWLMSIDLGGVDLRSRL